MFRMIVSSFRWPVILYNRLSGFDCEPAASAIFQAFASAAAACVYCSPYYPLPENLVLLEEEDLDAEMREGEFMP